VNRGDTLSVSRDTIIDTLRDHLALDPAILAMWLGGADASGHVDPFSDIDLCCSVEAGSMDAIMALAQRVLESLGPIDLIDNSSRGKDYQYTVFHLQDTSPYCLIDFNVFVGRGSRFTAGDAIEQPLILFDRAGVIQFAPPDDRQIRIDQAARLPELLAITAQVSRIEKYIRRGDFLEAFGYYHKWLLTPLIEVLRMRYTPLHPDYYIVHISRHLPAEILGRLENLFKIGSLSELETKSLDAYSFFKETAAFLQSETNKE
jgi:hypothetical protein